ncbi:MAG: RNase adapter RapZ [Alphaproteobacteria bacterium]|nr:RNase adapter RapZ [Alphaproteobacteria bacterium SS10]
MRDQADTPQFVIVSGLSGAGLSSALKALEDVGFEAIDNLPLPLLAGLIAQGDFLRRHVAVGIDTRTRGFEVPTLISARDELMAQSGVKAALLFLDCGDEVLTRRFTETRRRHPLALDRPVADGIAHERQLLGPLRDAADLTIDTSDLSIHDLRRLVAGHFGEEGRGGLSIFVTSFSFKRGVPREADLVFDVRFLKNPHYDPELRPLTGLDQAVADAVQADPGFEDFEAHLLGLLRPLLPRYRAEGKRYLTIAIGCTGGRHRSVFLAERLGAALNDGEFTPQIAHRDLPK